MTLRLPPAEGKISKAGQDWMGRGPSTKKNRLWFHAGVDIGNKGGPVVAPESGRVAAVGQPIEGKTTIFGGYGPWVVAIYGDSGFFHWLAHVKDPVVKRNQYVEAGQVVALGTGTKWPHVHWEIRQVLIPYKGEKYWPWTVSIDPIRWLNRTELTGLDALHRVKLMRPDTWRDRDTRMRILRPSGYEMPIRLRWDTSIQASVTAALKKLYGPREELKIAVGIVGGLAILALFLKM